MKNYIYWFFWSFGWTWSFCKYLHSEENKCGSSVDVVWVGCSGTHLDVYTEEM